MRSPRVQLLHDFKGEIRAATKLRLSGWRMVCWIAVCAAIAWPLNSAGRLDLALPILNCIGVLGFITALNWSLRRRRWFWIVITIIAALHVLVLMFIPWTNKWVPAFTIAAIDSADICILIAIFVVLRRFMDGPTMSEEAES